MRVVSLCCSNTEIVCALGCGDLLVGVDDNSDFPTEIVEALPKLGPDLQIDIDAVAALKPDIVLASLTVPGHEAVLEGLTAASLPFIAPEPTSLADIYDDIQQIADALGVSHAAQAVIDEMKEICQPLPPLATSPRLLVQWWPKPVFAPGKQSWVNDLIQLVGAQNPIGDEEVKSRALTDEEVLAFAPDAFVLSWCGIQPDKVKPKVVLRNPHWQSLPAIQKKRIVCVPEAYLGRPSPRLIDGYIALRDLVHSLQPT